MYHRRRDLSFGLRTVTTLNLLKDWSYRQNRRLAVSLWRRSTTADLIIDRRDFSGCQRGQSRLTTGSRRRSCDLVRAHRSGGSAATHNVNCDGIAVRNFHFAIRADVILSPANARDALRGLHFVFRSGREMMDISKDTAAAEVKLSFDDSSGAALVEGEAVNAQGGIFSDAHHRAVFIEEEIDCAAGSRADYGILSQLRADFQILPIRSPICGIVRGPANSTDNGLILLRSRLHVRGTYEGSDRDSKTHHPRNCSNWSHSFFCSWFFRLKLNSV
jgi:hypothetical protein